MTFENLAIVRCSYCTLSYIPSIQEDIEEHSLFHSRYESAATLLEYLPAGYEDREKIKAQGDEIYHEANSTSEKIAGAKMVLRGLFDREVITKISHGSPIDRLDFMTWARDQDLEGLFPLSDTGAKLRKQLA